MSETKLYGALRKLASKMGGRLFRNHVGVGMSPSGHIQMNGLCPGSSDLIGWMPGGVFTAVEVKSERGAAGSRQDDFIAAVIAAGGFGCVVRSESEFIQAYEDFKNGIQRIS